MNFISLCSHKAVVSFKFKDAEIILEALDNLAQKISITEGTKLNYSEEQKKLRKIRDLERKFTSILKWTKLKENKDEQKNNQSNNL